jgi:osmotically-inducible protein OsmY
VSARARERAEATRADARRVSRSIGSDLNGGWITTKILAQYYTKPDLKPWNIDVTTTDNGIVTLEGAVPDQAARDTAVSIARQTEGVTRVEDHLGISGERPSSAQPVEDAWITTKIQAKYFLDEDVAARRVNVETNRGVVTLAGEVASEGERRHAIAIARSTDGVTEVRDQLTIVPETRTSATRDRRETADNATERVGDTWITTKIQSKYFLDEQVRGSSIDVDTRDGVVTLKGQIESSAARQMAETIARETDGVRRVVNQLTVGTAKSK